MFLANSPPVIVAESSAGSYPFYRSHHPWHQGHWNRPWASVVQPPPRCGSWQPIHAGRCLPPGPVAGVLGSVGRGWCGSATSRHQSAAATGSKVSPCWSASPSQQVLLAGCWTSPWATGWSMWDCRSTRANYFWMDSMTCTTWWVTDLFNVLSLFSSSPSFITSSRFLEWLFNGFCFVFLVLCKKKPFTNVNVINWCKSSTYKSSTSLFEMAREDPAPGLMLGSVLKINGMRFVQLTGVPLGSVCNEDWWRRE